MCYKWWPSDTYNHSENSKKKNSYPQKVNFSKNSCASWSQNWLPGTNLGAKIGYPGTKLGAEIGYPEQTWEPKFVTQKVSGKLI